MNIETQFGNQMRLRQSPLARTRTIGCLRLPTLFLATAVAARSCLPAVHSLATTAKMTKNVVAFEGQPAEASAETSKDFLISRPSGAYTTARTCSGGKRIFEWEAHVERTAKSLASMMENEAADVSKLSDPSVLRRRLDAAVEQAVRLHQKVNEDSQHRELKLTALVGWTKATDDGSSVTPNSDTCNRDGWVACHVTTLPPIPVNPVRVEVRGSPRENAAAKDSAWVSERAPLEALMSGAKCGPVNELLLANEEGEILEGSQTNFYAIVDGTVWTAGEGILEGTVRGLVLDVCRREGIPVVLRPPKLDNLEAWEGAIISSTSRLALPIDELYMPADGLPSATEDLRTKFDNGSESIAARIQRLVSMEVEARSTPIGEPVLI